MGILRNILYFFGNGPLRKYGVVPGHVSMFLVDHFLVAALLGRPSRTGDSCSHGHCTGTVVLRFSRFVRVPHRRPLTAAARCHSAAATASAVLELQCCDQSMQAVTARNVLQVG